MMRMGVAGMRGEEDLRTVRRVRRIIVLAALAMVLLLPSVSAQSQDTVASLKERIIDIQNQGSLGFKNLPFAATSLVSVSMSPTPTIR